MDKFDIAGRVKELNEASNAYYNIGQSIMSDYEFDKKLEELRKEYGVEIHDDKLNGDFNTYMSKLKTSSNNSNNK